MLRVCLCVMRLFGSQRHAEYFSQRPKNKNKQTAESFDRIKMKNVNK